MDESLAEEGICDEGRQGVPQISRSPYLEHLSMRISWDQGHEDGQEFSSAVCLVPSYESESVFMLF